MKNAYNLDELSVECENAIKSKSVDELDKMATRLLKLETDLVEDIEARVNLAYFLGNIYSNMAKLLQENSYSWRNDIFPKNKVLAINYFRKSMDVLAAICQIIMI